MGSRFHISHLQHELTFLLGCPLTYTLKREKLQRKREKNCKTVTSDYIENEWILHLNVRSIDNHFEELETLIESFGVNKPSLDCCSVTWMVESSGEDLYVLDYYASMNFQPGKTRNEGVSKYVHESLSFEIIEFDIRIDLNYIAISCTNLKKAKIIVVCLYNHPSINNQYFLEQFEVLLESCCQMSNCFLVGDMNIDLLETSAIGSKYLNSLKLNGCYQGIKEPTRVTPTSLPDHIVHNDCPNNLEFAVIKTNITDHYAIMSNWI